MIGLFSLTTVFVADSELMSLFRLAENRAQTAENKLKRSAPDQMGQRQMTTTPRNTTKVVNKITPPKTQAANMLPSSITNIPHRLDQSRQQVRGKESPDGILN